MQIDDGAGAAQRVEHGLAIAALHDGYLFAGAASDIAEPATATVIDMAIKEQVDDALRLRACIKLKRWYQKLRTAKVVVVEIGLCIVPYLEGAAALGEVVVIPPGVAVDLGLV